MATNPNDISLSVQQRRRLAELADEAGRPWDEVLDEFLLGCRSRQNAQTSNETCYDLVQRAGLTGTDEEAPPDLSTNPAYFEGFGRE